MLRIRVGCVQHETRSSEARLAPDAPGDYHHAVVRDLVAWSMLVVAFATLLTAHVAIAVRLAFRKPRYRSVLALVVVPLAPVFAYRAKWRVSFWAWSVAVAVYAVARVMSG